MDHEIVVIDYHKGNLQSVARSVADAAPSVDVVISDDPQEIVSAEGLILPGVGSFEDAMTFMEASGQAKAVRDAVLRRSVPFLGICLGLHLLFSRGEERSASSSLVEGSNGDTHNDAGNPEFIDEPPVLPERSRWVEGLGILPGSVTRLESSRLKVPHVGWDQIHLTDVGQRCPLLVDVPEGANVYFTHSFALADDVRENVVATRTHYVRSFASAVWKDNIFGVQFHPEKSSQTGLRVLENFVSVVRG